jgi:hypothetical protein
MLVAGRPGSGKTYAVCAIIRELLKVRTYDSAWFFCPTLHTQDVYVELIKHLKAKDVDVHVHDDLTPELQATLKGTPNALYVFDDLETERMKAVSFVVRTCRPAKSDVITITHALIDISCTMRSHYNLFLVGALGNSSWINWAAREYFDGQRRMLRDFYRELMRTRRYGFVLINTEPRSHERLKLTGFTGDWEWHIPDTSENRMMLM